MIITILELNKNQIKKRDKVISKHLQKEIGLKINLNPIA